MQKKRMRGVYLLAAVSSAAALNNGLGQTPVSLLLQQATFSALVLADTSSQAMGYSTWNDCSSFRDNGPNGWCWDSEDHVKNVTSYLISSGLAKLGYTQVNVDEGWLKGRYPNGTIYEDLDKCKRYDSLFWRENQQPTDEELCSSLGHEGSGLLDSRAGNVTRLRRIHALRTLLVSRYLPVRHGHLLCPRQPWLRS